jgi:diguanylate cyclase (GGDEF)-like protein
LITPVLSLIAVAVLANLAVMAIVVLPPMFGRASPLAREADPDLTPERRAAEAAVIGRADLGTDVEVLVQTYDRVVRVVAWAVIVSTALIVALTGLWPDTQAAILLLLAFSAVSFLVVHELLPADALGPAKFVLEGSVAITVATLLVALTDGVDSPFFFVFPLIVGGAALVVTPFVTVVLTAAATAGYILAVVAGSPADSLGSGATAAVGVNLIALILLAYAAMVIAREQRRARDAAIRLSTVDPLTGLFNRNFFFAAMDREIARCARSGRGFCLLMMDVDELKAINDRLGHFEGDRVLRGVGEVISQGVRRIDTAARYGGDEFVVVLPETDPTGAFVLAEKIRLGVSALGDAVPAEGPRPSLSIGVVGYPEDGQTADELIISADGAMYASKRSGKDRVTGAPVERRSQRPSPV